VIESHSSLVFSKKRVFKVFNDYRLDMKAFNRMAPQRLIAPRIFFLRVMIPKVLCRFLEMYIGRIIACMKTKKQTLWDKRMLSSV
jgi:hypothetical protein